MMKQLIIGSQAKPSKKQHTSPCSDCPFSRKALPGWLGTLTAEEWVQAVHGEARIDCHTVSNQQCAGAAIYRANVCKSPRDKSLLRLPPNTTKVFSWMTEFIAHHTK
jgi:hypothetical protein